MSKKKLKRKPTTTFNLSLTIPDDVPVMVEVKKLVREGYSFGLAFKKILVDWQPPVIEKVWTAEEVLMMMKTLAGVNVDQPTINYSKEMGV